jgi:hypothetical protein
VDDRRLGEDFRLALQEPADVGVKLHGQAARPGASSRPGAPAARNSRKTSAAPCEMAGAQTRRDLYVGPLVETMTTGVPPRTDLAGDALVPLIEAMTTFAGKRCARQNHLLVRKGNDARQLVSRHARHPVAPGAIRPRSRPGEVPRGEPSDMHAR